MKLILISPSKKQDSEIGMVLHMFEQGLKTYHVRKKRYNKIELKKYLEEIPEKYHSRLVIHSHHELALDFNLKGIYISRSYKNKRKLKSWLTLRWLKIRKPTLEYSITVRNIENIIESAKKNEYIFLAPIFDSKPGNFQAGFTDYVLKPVLESTGSKIVARGGITISNIQKARDLGFGGVAFYSGIWQTPNPLQEFLNVKAKFEELSIPME